MRYEITHTVGFHHVHDRDEGGRVICQCLDAGDAWEIATALQQKRDREAEAAADERQQYDDEQAALRAGFVS